MNADLKNMVWATCLEMVQNRIEGTTEAMEAAQQAANQEGKSSVGDKYETTRAMMQRERAQMAQQLAESVKLKKALLSLDADKENENIEPGTLVKTANGLFYFAVGLGKVEVEGTQLFAISGASPIGRLMAGKKAGEAFSFNGRDFQIEEIF